MLGHSVRKNMNLSDLQNGTYGSVNDDSKVDGGCWAVVSHSKQVIRKPASSSKARRNVGPRQTSNMSQTVLDLPADVVSRGILPYLNPADLLSLGSCSSQARFLCDEPVLWRKAFRRDFPCNFRVPASEEGWKFAYRMYFAGVQYEMRCARTQKTCVEDIVGVGLDYTVNPKTKRIDHISLSRNLLSATAFKKTCVRQDAFGNKIKLLLPLYFNREHFHRALPLIQRTIIKLCPEKRTSKFHPSMILDTFPKIINTFVVLLADKGVCVSSEIFNGLIRIHRLFLALSFEYPIIQKEAESRLRAFASRESHRMKSKCPSLGSMLPLLMIVDQQKFSWQQIRAKYLSEQFDRSVLWVCKEFPKLEKLPKAGQAESLQDEARRIIQSKDAMTVALRHTMFHTYFVQECCRGSVLERALSYDAFFMNKFGKGSFADNDEDHDEVIFEQQQSLGTDLYGYIAQATLQYSQTSETQGPESQADSQEKSSETGESAGANQQKGYSLHAISFETFREQINYILTVNGWRRFFRFVGVRGPQSKGEMAALLRMHVKNSLRKKYHKAGMDFSRVQARGSSRILSKGEKYSARSDLKRVIFTDVWKFRGRTKYLDATCLLYSGKRRLETVDYISQQGGGGSITHSGDMINGQQGTHVINLDLEALPKSVTSCIFVISAWSDATLSDIVSPSVAFKDADAEEDSPALCVYNLDSHDKVSHKTSVIMCKLYRLHGSSQWHVQAIGESHRGDASNYSPIYEAANKLA